MPKSWSGLRKELENDFICDSLKGRIQYFLTHYHGAPDNYGRVAVRVDGKEIIRGNPYSFFIKYSGITDQAKRELDIPRRKWTGKEFLYDEENKAVEQSVEEMAIEDGVFEIYHITDAIREYKNQPIEQSICSVNPVIRMFAVLDRRVGKRTLKKIAEAIEEQPEWLQYFYKLRLDAEGIERTKKVDMKA